MLLAWCNKTRCNHTSRKEEGKQDYDIEPNNFSQPFFFSLFKPYCHGILKKEIRCDHWKTRNDLRTWKMDKIVYRY